MKLAAPGWLDTIDHAGALRVGFKRGATGPHIDIADPEAIATVREELDRLTA